MAPSFRFPSLGLTFCPECGVELDPTIDTYKDGKVEYMHRFHNACPNSDKQFLVDVAVVEAIEISSKVN